MTERGGRENGWLWSWVRGGKRIPPGDKGQQDKINNSPSDGLILDETSNIFPNSYENRGYRSSSRVIHIRTHT